MIKLFWNTHNQIKHSTNNKSSNDYIWGVYHKENSDKWIFEILSKIQYKIIKSEKEIENQDILIIIDSSVEKKSELYSMNLLTVSKSIYCLVKSNFILIFNKYM